MLAVATPVSITSSQEKYIEVSQRLQDVGDRRSILKGVCILVLDGTFFDAATDLPSGEIRRFRATELTGMNKETIGKTDLTGAIREKRIATFHVENGVIKYLSVHHTWVHKMEEENALTVAIRNEIGGDYHIPKENDDIGICPLPEESYQNMIRRVGLEKLNVIDSKKESNKDECIILWFK